MSTSSFGSVSSMRPVNEPLTAFVYGFAMEMFGVVTVAGRGLLSTMYGVVDHDSVPVAAGSDVC
jgi:hypothetical protein